MNLINVSKIIGIGTPCAASFKDINHESDVYEFDVDLKEVSDLFFVINVIPASAKLSLVCIPKTEGMKETEIELVGGKVNAFKLDTLPYKRNDNRASFKLVSGTTISDVAPKMMVLSYQNVVNN